MACSACSLEELGHHDFPQNSEQMPRHSWTFFEEKVMELASQQKHKEKRQEKLGQLWKVV